MKERLPARPDLQQLKKLAKARLADLRVLEPATRLHQAQLDIARDYGYPSWRALKAYVESLGPALAPTAQPLHLPSPDAIDAWPDFTPERPLKLIVSGCLAGLAVLANGSAYDVQPGKAAADDAAERRRHHFLPRGLRVRHAAGDPRHPRRNRRRRARRHMVAAGQRRQRPRPRDPARSR